MQGWIDRSRFLWVALGLASSQTGPMKPVLTSREEANAIVCWAFRNGFLEELHAGERSALLESSKYSRITNAEMKKLMVECATKMAEILQLRDRNPAKYWSQIMFFHESYTKNWLKE